MNVLGIESLKFSPHLPQLTPPHLLFCFPAIISKSADGDVSQIQVQGSYRSTSRDSRHCLLWALSKQQNKESFQKRSIRIFICTSSQIDISSIGLSLTFFFNRNLKQLHRHHLFFRPKVSTLTGSSYPSSTSDSKVLASKPSSRHQGRLSIRKSYATKPGKTIKLPSTPQTFQRALLTKITNSTFKYI